MIDSRERPSVLPAIEERFAGRLFAYFAQQYDSGHPSQIVLVCSDESDIVHLVDVDLYEPFADHASLQAYVDTLNATRGIVTRTCFEILRGIAPGRRHTDLLNETKRRVTQVMLARAPLIPVIADCVGADRVGGGRLASESAVTDAITAAIRGAS